MSGTVTILGASTHWVTVITPVLVIVLVLLLQWLINHTKIGMAMRAVAKDFETSQLMGIKINKVISVTFIIGICENLLKGMKLTAFSDAFTFALLIVILVVKPTGLFGEKLTEKV